MTPIQLPAENLFAYRVLRSGLDRRSTVGRLDIWPVGLQDRDGSAGLALAARLDGEPPKIGEPHQKSDLVQLWSLRGSPHVHRRSTLDRLACQLWPTSEADAVARLVGSGKALQANGVSVLEAIATVAAAMHRAAVEPIGKGALSAAVTAAVPQSMSGHCAGCNSTHVFEMLFRSAAFPAGLGLVPGSKPVVLERLSDTPPLPTAESGLARMMSAFYRLYGVAGHAEAGAHVGATAGTIKAHLPTDLIDVEVDGTRTRSTPELVDRIRSTDPSEVADIVRLLPPGDPLLQPRERGLTTRDAAMVKALWPTIGPAGALLVGTAVVGTWRTRKAGKKLAIEITGKPPAKKHQQALDHEAQLVGTLRGADTTTVTWKS